MREKRADLSRATQAACTDASRRRCIECWRLAANQDIAGILTLASHEQTQAGRLHSRQVFQAMHRDINASLGQGALKLNYKNTIAANLRQRHMGNSIARRANLLNNYLQVWPVALESLDNPARLYHRQFAGACPDD